MTERVSERLEEYLKREYRSERRKNETGDAIEKLKDLPPLMYHAKLMEAELKAETPHFYGKDDLFGFNMSRDDLLDRSLWFNNLSTDYERPLNMGLRGILAEVDERYPSADERAREFYDALRVCFEACFDIIARYRKAAKERGCEQLYRALCRVPEYGATDYYEALVTLKFLQYSMRLNHNAHITLGRFDKYMRPYYLQSRAQGVPESEILELTELFFISLNYDSDLYFGVQQGDNGQSIMLGGVDRDGVTEVFNPLSEIVLTAAEELRLIDPKINIRVNKNTPLSLYERGTRLTKLGLGFPQYSNDDVVIEGLIKLGYEPADARDYTVAACWEFIIPGYGADIVNLASFNYPLAVDEAVRGALSTAKNFDELMTAVDKSVEKQCGSIIEKCNSKLHVPAEPYYSAFILPCIAEGRDMSQGGGKYRNYGVHGAGLSTAADSLAAIKKLVFDEKSVEPKELLAALDADFEGYAPLRERLRDCPKMGNNDDYVDGIATMLMESFSKHLNGKPNNCGGVFRAGTGSAQDYIFAARKVGATADGRKAHEPFASSFSPAIDARINGPLSAIQSFTKYDLSNVINGGPFTIEIHDTVFRNEEGEKKVAQLIKSFIDLGGHQMQINAINRDILLDAKAHPERHQNLIVRVWGWSGYFNELDTEFQDHIIRRVEFTFG